FERFDRGLVICCFQPNPGEHERADIGGDHSSARSNDGRRRSCDRTSPGCDVQDHVPARRGHEGQ
ncbi:MAG TPA: hypothetical protein VGL48_01395, partial [Acidimicrobiales bacterium]